MSYLPVLNEMCCVWISILNVEKQPIKSIITMEDIELSFSNGILNIFNDMK